MINKKIKRLEEIRFIKRGTHNEAFEKGFQETLRYKEQSGEPNAMARHTTPNGYNLGIWQACQRRKYKKDKLNTERIKRLEEIGFNWYQLEAFFEKGFQETLRFKEQTGETNAPAIYTTANGYKLGNWQRWQRSNYKNGKLAPARVKRLERIGFKWTIKKGRLK